MGETSKGCWTFGSKELRICGEMRERGIRLRDQELINEDEETMDIEEARAMVHETIRKEYDFL